MRKIIIAIDGYSGTGKSSTAKAVASELGYLYIDSGAMYRATTLHFLEQKVDIDDKQNLLKALDTMKISLQNDKVLLNNRDVSLQIRSMEVNSKVSEVSTKPEIRKALVAQQQGMGKSGGIVMDGRDIGTVVFPQAELKIFMMADAGVRAKRRQLELAEKGINVELSSVEINLKERDKTDSERVESPLRKAEGAVEINTSKMDFQEQVRKIIQLAEKLIYEN